MTQIAREGCQKSKVFIILVISTAWIVEKMKTRRNFYFFYNFQTVFSLIIYEPNGCRRMAKNELFSDLSPLKELGLKKCRIQNKIEIEGMPHILVF